MIGETLIKLGGHSEGDAGRISRDFNNELDKNCPNYVTEALNPM
jgi:hypothetical protein